MIEIDSALFILMAEVSTVIIVVAVLLLFVSKHRKGKEIAEIEKFVNRIAEEEAQKNRSLEKILLEECKVEPDKAEIVLQEVHAAERALLQRVIQMLLQRDPKLLHEIDRLIAKLSDPYFKLLSDTVSFPGSETSNGFSGSKQQQVSLEHINEQLVKQLDTAMQTIDEISSEYTRAFGTHQSALELENSSKRMLQIFQDAEQAIKNNFGISEGM